MLKHFVFQQTLPIFTIVWKCFFLFSYFSFLLSWKKLLLRTDANLKKVAIHKNSGWTFSSRGKIDCFSRQHTPNCFKHKPFRRTLTFAHWTTKLKYHGRNPDMQQCQNMYRAILKDFKITVFTQGYYWQNKWKFYGLRKETQF